MTANTILYKNSFELLNLFNDVLVSLDKMSSVAVDSLLTELLRR